MYLLTQALASRDGKRSLIGRAEVDMLRKLGEGGTANVTSLFVDGRGNLAITMDVEGEKLKFLKAGQDPAAIADSGTIRLGDSEPNEFSAVVLSSLGGQLLADTQVGLCCHTGLTALLFFP